MSAAESDQHEHVWERAQIRHRDGAPIEGGRRCSCGLEVVGDGPFALNANIVRAAREFNRGVAEAMNNIGRAMEAGRKRRFPS